MLSHNGGGGDCRSFSTAITGHFLIKLRADERDAARLALRRGQALNVTTNNNNSQANKTDFCVPNILHCIHSEQQSQQQATITHLHLQNGDVNLFQRVTRTLLPWRLIEVKQSNICTYTQNIRPHCSLAQLTTTSHTISLWETIILGECTSHDVVIDVGASKTSTHPGGSVKVSNSIGPVSFEWVPLSSTLHK